MKVHAIWSQPHYLRHVESVFKHLPDEIKGSIINVKQRQLRSTPYEDVVMVGGYYDIHAAPKNRVIYVEHGAGQAYSGDKRASEHPCYHGGRHPNNVIGYISPRQDVAESWSAPGFAAGCPAVEGIVRKPSNIAVITFHWDARAVCEEARSAANHYHSRLEMMVQHLQSQGFQFVGHWHPKDNRGKRRWLKMGLPVVEDVDEILSKASLLIADNTSLMYEAALCGIPVVALNAPWYRREVEHGLRFWSHVPGWQIDSPEQFLETDFRTYVDNDLSANERNEAVRYCYGTNLGGKEAARWVTDLVASM